MPPDLALSSTLIGLNNPCLELIFMVPKVFEPLKFYCKHLDQYKSIKNVKKMEKIKEESGNFESDGSMAKGL